MTQLEIEAVTEQNSVPVQIDCGYNHTLILYHQQKPQEEMDRQLIFKEG